VTNLVDVRDLSVDYFTPRGPLTVVDRVDLQIKRGSAMALVGESGSGKTSLAMAVMGLIHRPVGRVRAAGLSVDGVDVLTLSGRASRRFLRTSIGYVPQDPVSAMDPLYTIERQITETLGRMPRGERRDRAVALLSSLGVANAAARIRSHPHQFSGGMLQRVVLAIAVAGRPSLLVADEPTTALDVTTQLLIINLLNDLRIESDATMLYVTHDLAVAAVVCQQIAVMYGGCIVERGAIGEIMTRPAHPYTRALLGSIPSRGRPKARLASIPGDPPSSTRDRRGCAFAPRCPLADEHCREHRPSLVGSADRAVACWKA
jgi:oligopeptide/dipeptide ABC transporter ATP-binding protein